MKISVKMVIAAIAALAMANVGLGSLAYAAKTKTCETITETPDNPSNGWTTKDEDVNTQTSSCNSNSDTGFEPVSSETTVTNPGGKQPPAKN